MWNYLTWLVVLIEENFPHDLLVANILKNAAPELFIFTNNSVKHKKTKIKVCLETLLKNSLSWNTVSWGNLSWFLSFLSPPLTPCYNSSARFPELVRPLFLLLDHFCAVLWSLNGVFWQTHSLLVSTIGVMVFLVFLIFS